MCWNYISMQPRRQTGTQAAGDRTVEGDDPPGGRSSGADGRREADQEDVERMETAGDTEQEQRSFSLPQLWLQEIEDFLPI